MEDQKTWLADPGEVRRRAAEMCDDARPSIPAALAESVSLEATKLVAERDCARTELEHARQTQDCLIQQLEKLSEARNEHEEAHAAEVELLRGERDEAMYRERLAKTIAVNAQAERDFLRAEVERMRGERDEAREHTSTAAFMRIERERDEARHRARRACQVLIAEVGAHGPADVDSVAERSAAEIQNLRDEIEGLRAEVERLHTERDEAWATLERCVSVQRATAEGWRLKVDELASERDEARAEVERVRGERDGLVEELTRAINGMETALSFEQQDRIRFQNELAALRAVIAEQAAR